MTEHQIVTLTAALTALVLTTAVVGTWAGLGLSRAVVTASVRALVQLLAVGAVIPAGGARPGPPGRGPGRGAGARSDPQRRSGGPARCFRRVAARWCNAAAGGQVATSRSDRVGRCRDGGCGYADRADVRLDRRHPP